jgi:hypothetical protein
MRSRRNPILRPHVCANMLGFISRGAFSTVPTRFSFFILHSYHFFWSGERSHPYICLIHSFVIHEVSAVARRVLILSYPTQPNSLSNDTSNSPPPSPCLPSPPRPLPPHPDPHPQTPPTSLPLLANGKCTMLRPLRRPRKRHPLLPRPPRLLLLRCRLHLHVHQSVPGPLHPEPRLVRPRHVHLPRLLGRRVPDFLPRLGLRLPDRYL